MPTMRRSVDSSVFVKAHASPKPIMLPKTPTSKNLKVNCLRRSPVVKPVDLNMPVSVRSRRNVILLIVTSRNTAETPTTTAITITRNISTRSMMSLSPSADESLHLSISLNSVLSISIALSVLLLSPIKILTFRAFIPSLFAPSSVMPIVLPILLTDWYVPTIVYSDFPPVISIVTLSPMPLSSSSATIFVTTISLSYSHIFPLIAL